MVEICQTYLPVRPWELDDKRRLPGLNPIAPGEWLIVDECYAEQMAYRMQLMRDRREVVHRLDPSAQAAARELLQEVLTELAERDDFQQAGDKIICPDGREVAINWDAPMITAGRLVQEDLVLMQKQGDEHVLTGAILCFPASWSLAQKFMKPMTRIHAPVSEYTENIARRVQRLFDGIQVGRPMWRANYLVYADPDLHQPRTEEERRPSVTSGPRWLRVERQGMKRLPETGAVVFSIHSYVITEQCMAELDVSLPSHDDMVTAG